MLKLLHKIEKANGLYFINSIIMHFTHSHSLKFKLFIPNCLKLYEFVITMDNIMRPKPNRDS